MQASLFNDDKNLLPYHGEAFLHSGVFNKTTSAFYFKELLGTIAWKQEPIIIFGKKVMQPRMTAWYGDSNKAYTYSGVTMQPLPWTTVLNDIKQQAEQLAGTAFTSALLNLYRDGNDSMGWHRDNEAELGNNPVIASVSFGATRLFKFRDHHSKKVTIPVELTDGSILVMGGRTQHYWEHAVPKTNKPVGARINITFRVIR